MALIVHKYGGTSMGSTERIRNVAKRVAKWARAGHQMVVVPSAMSGETNRLLGLAKELAPSKADEAYQRELDMLASTGEQASVALLAIALQTEGHGGRQLRRLAGAHSDQQRLHQGPHRVDRRQARARRPGRRQGGHHRRLPGRGRTRQHHHPRPRRQRHLGRGRGRGAEGPNA
jgi:aspartokinase